MEPEVNIENEARSSIEVTRGMKGETGWKIKLYLRPEEVDAGPARIEALNNAMKDRFS